MVKNYIVSPTSPDSTESLTIEIVGVAGSGKSSLTSALRTAYPSSKITEFLQARDFRHWPYMAHSIPKLLPIITHRSTRRKPITWANMKWLIYIIEWRRFLQRQEKYSKGLALIDQGPIFALARLFHEQRSLCETRMFYDWAARMVTDWSSTLDAIVWLDAPDEILMERINSRNQDHEVKDESYWRMREFLASYRQAFGMLYDLVDQGGSLKQLSFDTSKISVEEIIAELDKTLSRRGKHRLFP